MIVRFAAATRVGSAGDAMPRDSEPELAPARELSDDRPDGALPEQDALATPPGAVNSSRDRSIVEILHAACKDGEM